MQRGPGQAQRPDGRDFSTHQFLGKTVFLQNLGLAPAPWPVKLGHYRAAVLQLHLIDPVFVGGQGGQPPVASQTDRFERVQDQIGR